MVDKNLSLIKFKCGASIGWLNYSWPFAEIDFRKTEIELKTLYFKKYLVNSKEIRSIEKFVHVPYYSWGIKFFLKNTDIVNNFTIWTFKHPEVLIEKLKEIYRL